MTQKPFIPAKRLPNDNPKDNKCHHYLIQFFIHHNTYGTVWHDGLAFDLIDRIDHDVLLMWLVAEGHVSYTDEVERYPYNSGYDTKEIFLVHHPSTTYIHKEAKRFFWYNLLDRLLPQLNDDELQLFNAERKERYDAILQRHNQSQL